MIKIDYREYDELDDHEMGNPDCLVCRFLESIYILRGLEGVVHPSKITDGITEEGILAVCNAIDYLRLVAYGQDMTDMDEGDE